jgi:hypothetical protein
VCLLTRNRREAKYKTLLPYSAKPAKLTGKMYPEPCLADPLETAEDFVMERMDPQEAAAYAEHLARCQVCSKVVEMTRASVQGMRDASRQLVDDEKAK